jgi:hypothetical protein
MDFYLQEPYQAPAQVAAKNRVCFLGVVVVAMLVIPLRNPLNRTRKNNPRLRNLRRVSLIGYPGTPSGNRVD